MVKPRKKSALHAFLAFLGTVIFSLLNALVVVFNTMALSLSYLFASIAFIAIYVGSIVFGVNGIMAGLLVFLYVTLSPITAYIYFLDKAAARSGEWRIPEARLHLLEIAGGLPGALIAQQVLRHKTVKRSYQNTFALILLYHLYLWIIFFVFRGHHGWTSLFFVVPAMQAARGQS